MEGAPLAPLLGTPQAAYSNVPKRLPAAPFYAAMRASMLSKTGFLNAYREQPYLRNEARWAP